MKVLLQKNVSRLGIVGDLVDVKPGYARNYLLPHGLAVEPTQANVRAVEVAKQAYLEELAKIRSELQAKATVADGKEIVISARANEEGHLYGSIGPAQIVAALAGKNVFIEPEQVGTEATIRELGTYEIPLSFGQDITAKISLSVTPIAGQEDAPEPDDAEQTALPPDQPADDEGSSEQG